MPVPPLRTPMSLAKDQCLVASVAEIMRCGFTVTHTIFIEFSTNFKQGRGQIVFSIVA